MKRANSSSATEELSILTALVFEMPNVRDACPPMSDSTSDAERPSIDVPSIRRKSLSAAPLVNTATLPLLIPVAATAAVPSPRVVRCAAASASSSSALPAAVRSYVAALPEPLNWIPLSAADVRPASACSSVSRRAFVNGAGQLTGIDSFVTERLRTGQRSYSAVDCNSQGVA